jgi:hypothetical protein
MTFSLFPAHISFPLTPVQKVDVTTLVVLRHEYQMDTARLALNVSYDDLNQYVGAGSPLRIRWGSQLRFDEFIGYVHSFRPMTDEITKKTEIVAISAAYPMFNESGTTYTNVGIHNVVQEIGNNYRFQVETDPHPYVHDQILQKGDSDWGLLARLASQWGYILMMDGVTLIFRPLKDVLAENYRYSFTAKTSAMGTLDPLANIISFEESYSATGTQPLTESGLYGVDPISVEVVSQKGIIPIAGVFDEINSSNSVTSNLEGELKSAGTTTRRQFPYEARGTFRAAYRRKPFDAYRIFNDGQFKTWIVRSVRHVVTGGDYLSEMVFGSDGLDHSQKSRDFQLDINTLLKQSRRAKRPQPMIINTRPYYVGAGASVVVPDQRWKAQVMTVPVDDREAVA